MDVREQAPIGETIWHSSCEESGPDVGIEVRLSEDNYLYAGDVPGSPGCSLALYTKADRTLIASDVHSHEAREMIEAISLAIKSTDDKKEQS